MKTVNIEFIEGYVLVGEHMVDENGIAFPHVEVVKAYTKKSDFEKKSDEDIFYFEDGRLLDFSNFDSIAKEHFFLEKPSYEDIMNCYIGFLEEDIKDKKKEIEELQHDINRACDDRGRYIKAQFKRNLAVSKFQTEIKLARKELQAWEEVKSEEKAKSVGKRI